MQRTTENKYHPELNDGTVLKQLLKYLRKKRLDYFYQGYYYIDGDEIIQLNVEELDKEINEIIKRLDVIFISKTS